MIMLQPPIWRYGRMMDIFPEVRRLRREMNRFFTTVPGTANFPAINVWMGQEDLLLTMEMPGVDPQKLEVSIVGDGVKICGSRPEEEIKDLEGCYRRERSYGPFSRTVQLPFPIDISKVEALYEKGILQVSLPRTEAEKPRRITVRKE